MEPGIRGSSEPKSITHERCHGRPPLNTEFSDSLLAASEKVQRLQKTLHAKAKEAPGFRFYSLSDKVWRADVLRVVWQEVRRNDGSAGVDGETIADIESSGVERWLGELARDLKEGTGVDPLSWTHPK